MKPTDIESQVAEFLGKYSPEIQLQLREARTRLRAKFPFGYELVFDNYNALVFAISPTERRSDAFISVAGYQKWVTLFFLYGAELNDPNHLLEGQGKQVRSIRLKNPSDIDTPEVQTLISQASVRHESQFRDAPALSTSIMLALAKQRPRRPVQKKA